MQKKGKKYLGNKNCISYKLFRHSILPGALILEAVYRNECANNSPGWPECITWWRHSTDQNVHAADSILNIQFFINIIAKYQIKLKDLTLMQCITIHSSPTVMYRNKCKIRTSVMCKGSQINSSNHRYFVLKYFIYKEMCKCN